MFLLERLDLKYQESISLSSAKKLRIFSNNEDIRISNENASNWLNERGSILWNKTQENVVKDSAMMDVLPDQAGIQEQFADESKKIYKTTSTSCTCSFHNNNQFVCKHILVLRQHLSLPDFSTDLMHKRYHKLEMREAESQPSPVVQNSSHFDDQEEEEVDIVMATEDIRKSQVVDDSSVSVDCSVADGSSPRMSVVRGSASSGEPDDLSMGLNADPKIGEYFFTNERRNTISSTLRESIPTVTEEPLSHAAIQYPLTSPVSEKLPIIGQLCRESSSTHHLHPKSLSLATNGLVSACSNVQGDQSDSEQLFLSGNLLGFVFPDAAGEEVVGLGSQGKQLVILAVFTLCCI